MSESVERQYIAATMLFGEAVQTDIHDALDASWPINPTLGGNVADFVHYRLSARDIRYDVMSEKKKNHARGLLMAGVDDIGRILKPHMHHHNRERAYEIARHDDTVTTIAALALNSERRMNEIIAVNGSHRGSYDARIDGRGIMLEPTYFPDSDKGCPFAGKKFLGERRLEEARPLFKRFAAWAIELTLADLERKSHFEA